MRIHGPFAALLLGCALAPAGAQPVDAEAPLRDPMQPPAAAAPPASAASGVQAVPDRFFPRQILVVGGRAYVVDGGRRFSVGDHIGGDRIERIGPDAVWLRDGLSGARQRIPLHPGVTRRPVADPDVAAAPASAPALPRPAPQRSPKKESP